MSMSNIVSLKVNGKLTIDFRPTPPPPPSPPAAAPGASSPTPTVAPVQKWDKDKLLEAARQSLKDREHTDNQKIVEDVEQLYEGLQQDIRELEDRIDREDESRMRKRRRDN